MSTYDVINLLPHDLDLSGLTREELKSYRTWFFANESRRLTELQKIVTQSGFSDITLDFSPESLLRLGDFLAEVIRTRPLTETERERLRRIYPIYIDVDSYTTDLTDESYSILFDLGLYWGNVFIKCHPGLSWAPAKTRSKNCIYEYGHIVIQVNKRVSVNPYWMMKVLALKVVDGTFDRKRLYDLIFVWSESVHKSIE